MSVEYVTPSYISPSGLAAYIQDPRKYYLRYRMKLGGLLPKRTSYAMTLGSAFDTRVKLALQDVLGGFVGDVKEDYPDKDYVDSVASKIFDFYLESGAYKSLVADLARGRPMSEDLAERTVGGVPFLGKPDLWLARPDLDEVLIFDWKVSGWFDMRDNLKPIAQAMLEKGWKSLGSFWKCGDITPAAPGKFTREFGSVVSGRISSQPSNVKGWSTALSPQSSLEKWIHQLTIYRWTLGSPVGKEWVVGVEVVMPGRVTQYRAVISEKYQHWLLAKCQEVWAQASSPSWREPEIDSLVDAATNENLDSDTRGAMVEALSLIDNGMSYANVVPEDFAKW